MPISCFGYFQEDSERASFFMIGARSAGDVAQARLYRMLELCIDLIDAGRQQLDDPDSVSRLKAEAVVGAIYEAVLTGLQRTGVEGFPDLVPKLMYIAVLPYLGPEAAQEELRRGPQDFARYERGEL